MNVVIIGGGASGLMAALTAAEAGHNATVLERQSRVGRKLLSTGNGRCNLSNRHISIENYHGTEPDFSGFAIGAFGFKDTMSYFRKLGLITVSEPDGRAYPFSDQAGSVVDVLRLTADGLGVDILTNADVTSVRRENGGFDISFGDKAVSAQKLIVCCGGLAGRKLGGTASGYELLESLGHSRTKLRPALVQITTDTAFVRSLKGVRAQAEIKLKKSGFPVAHSCGEVQFTDFGLSGPSVFEISRDASVFPGGLAVSLDLLPGIERRALEALIAARCGNLPALTAENLLTGTLHNRLGRTVIRYAGLSLSLPLTKLDKTMVERVAAAVKSFSLEVTGTLDFDSAQVTAGGIRTSEFKPETLESRIVPGLYAAGEVLDIDGDCGGYNLQWAWSSGRLAGKLL